MDEALTIGERIRKRRRALGLSREALAERAGMTSNAISQYERGVRVPRLTVALNLAGALHTSLYYLATGRECGE